MQIQPSGHNTRVVVVVKEKDALLCTLLPWEVLEQIPCSGVQRGKHTSTAPHKTYTQMGRWPYG